MSPNLSFSLKSRQTFSFLLMDLYDFFAMNFGEERKREEEERKTKTLLNAMLSVILNYVSVIHTIN
jgi:hypothetical protein